MPSQTPASALYPLIRAALGDYDPSNFQYPNYILDAQITWATVLMNDPNNIQTYVDGGGVLQFTNQLTLPQQAEVSLNAAINIISRVDSEFSYRTPVLHVIRKGGSDRLFAYLREQLTTLQGGLFAYATDQDLVAMVWDVTRTVNSIAAAIAEGPGTQE